MKFKNLFETESLHVLPGNLLDDRPYVSISSGIGSLQFLWMMSTDQTRAMAQHMIELADQAEAEVLANQAIEMAVAA